jgi:transposase-like protein
MIKILCRFVPSKRNDMNLLEFNKRFPTEESCKIHLKELREKDGIECKRCGDITKHYWLEGVEKFQCSKCKSRTNLKTGTIMENSKVPMLKWFMCIHLMTSIKKSFSSLELQRQLGMSRYESTWEMVRKIRSSMGKRDSKYLLQGEIEIDDAFYEVVDLPKKDSLGNIKKEGLTRGRGSERQHKVLIMVESKSVVQTNEYKKDRKMGYVKMVVMDDLTSDGINYEIMKGVDENSNVLTDGYRGYNKVIDVVNTHTKMIVKPKEGHKKLPWVHTIIANSKRQLLGVHHSIGKEYLQGYLNEFCYKLNRRNFESDLFDRMLICGSQDTWN